VKVPTLDADRRDGNHHIAVAALGITDVLVAKNVGTAVLVDHRGFHRNSSRLSVIRSGADLGGRPRTSATVVVVSDWAPVAKI
jgi:hypothetical protein